MALGKAGHPNTHRNFVRRADELPPPAHCAGVKNSLEGSLDLDVPPLDGDAVLKPKRVLGLGITDRVCGDECAEMCKGLGIGGLAASSKVVGLA